MATPYCDFTHFQYSFSAEGACQKFKKWRARARARARLFSRLRNFAGGNASEKFKENLHCLDSASLFRTVSFSFLPNLERARVKYRESEWIYALLGCKIIKNHIF